MKHRKRTRTQLSKVPAMSKMATAVVAAIGVLSQTTEGKRKHERVEKKRSLQVQVQGTANYDEAIIEKERKRGRGERRRVRTFFFF